MQRCDSAQALVLGRVQCCGDDLLKAVIEQQVIPQFRNALIEAGGVNVTVH